MYFLMTIDVELFSIPLNREDFTIVEQIYKRSLPWLLDLLSKYDIKATFYFTGNFAELSPESVELVKVYDHEVGCHGYDHSPYKAFDLLNYEEQVKIIEKAKKAIENIIGKIEAFRAPMLRINEDTVKALTKTGFKTDSSIASQRFDGLFSFGLKKKLKWLFAPRKPYMLSFDSIIKKGNSGVLEIPISAFLLPFIGTTMRTFPTLTKMLQKLLFFESKHTKKPIVFLFHPNECLDFNGVVTTTRRANNLVEYFFADYLRQRIKLKNLGKASLKLLDEILRVASKHDFEFVTAKEYRRIYDRGI